MSITENTVEEIKAVPEEKLECDGAVFYCDGGAKPNPGYIGWGVHGYTYKNEAPKQGSGHPTHVLTARGYVSKSQKDKVKEVTPVRYFDGHGSQSLFGTNNVAEVLAATNAIRMAHENKALTVKLKSDSEYTIKGLTEWSPRWVKNNWYRADGSPVPNADKWKGLLGEMEKLEATGANFDIEWVKGHTDAIMTSESDVVVGNILADKLASVGVSNSIAGVYKTEFKITKPQGYWKKEIDKHPFFFNKRGYFNTLSMSHVKGEYYLGNHGTDDELLGRRMSDGALSVLQMQEPEPVYELIRSIQTEMSGDIDSIIMFRLDKMFNPTTYEELEQYGKAATVRANHTHIDLNALDGEPLTKELRPARLAIRTMTAAGWLKSMLNNYRAGDASSLKATDITDIFYEDEVTKKKTETKTSKKLKSEYVVGYASKTVDAAFITENGQITMPVTLSLGLDIADRNSLKRLEAYNPKVVVVTWSEAPDVFRYATIIEAKGDFVISAGVYSNTIYRQPT
jgi:ribonuclease HI